MTTVSNSGLVIPRIVFSTSFVGATLLIGSAAHAQPALADLSHAPIRAESNASEDGGAAAPTDAAPDAPAASEDAPDIVVTANRRTERLQDVPIAVNVLSNESLSSLRITDSQYLASVVPGLSVTKTNSNQYFLRGVGTSSSTINSEQSVASYLDGVYVYTTFGSMSVANVDRVEVLRGPQGTLFGRNTTGGVIQAVTRDPLATPSVEATLGYGNYQTLTGTFYGNAHLTPNLGVALSVDFRNQGEGYGRNTVRNEDNYFRDDVTARGKIAWQAGPDTRITALFQYRHQKDSGLNWIPDVGTLGLDGVPGSAYGRYETRGDAADYFRMNGYLGYVRLEQGLGRFATLTSITSYNRVNGVTSQDQEATPLDFSAGYQIAGFRNFAQELQLASQGSGRFRWLLGAYYYDALAELKPSIGTGTSGPVVARFRGQRTHSLAGFGQFSYEVFDGTTITAGLRYTDEHQRLTDNEYTLVGTGASQVRNPFPPSPVAPVDSSGWTWRLALDHKFSDDVMGYVSWNRGLKGGGQTLVTLATIPGYNPERLDAYETGLKLRFLNGRVRINPAAFLYKFRDIQYNAFIFVNGTPSARVSNAAAATITGFDLDASFQITRHFQLNAAIEFLHTKFDSFPNAVITLPKPAPAVGGTTSNADVTGNRLPYAPPFSASVGVTYRTPLAGGELVLDGAVRHLGRQFVAPSNFLTIPAYTLVGAGVGWTTANEHFGVRVWADNLFDQNYSITKSETGAGFFRIPGAPRTFGVTVSTRF